MNNLYRMNLINIHNHIKNLQEKEREGQGLIMLKSCSTMWAKSLDKVLTDYLGIATDKKQGDKMLKRTSYNYLNNLNNKKGVLVISRYLKKERGIITFTCGKEFLMFDNSLTDTEVIDNLYIYENIDTKTKEIK